MSFSDIECLWVLSSFMNMTETDDAVTSDGMEVAWLLLFKCIDYAQRRLRYC